jgi:chromosomal replication initiator protein
MNYLIIPGLKFTESYQPSIQNLTVQDIIILVCNYFKISISDITKINRKSSRVYARQIAIFLARKNTGVTYKELGEYFSGRDHSTMIHSERKVIDYLAYDEKVKKDIYNIQKLIYADPL